MKITKSQLKQIIKEELQTIQEVEYDDQGPMYAEPVEGEVTPDEAEVVIPGYGGLRVDQIKNRIAQELGDMSEAASAGEFRRIGSTRLKLLSVFLQTLEHHNALGD
jgi:hypothetical protein